MTLPTALFLLVILAALIALVWQANKRSKRNSPGVTEHSAPFGYADQGPDRGGNGGLG